MNDQHLTLNGDIEINVARATKHRLTSPTQYIVVYHNASHWFVAEILLG